MYSNISPYVCCNIPEFQEELEYLENHTFKNIQKFYDEYNVNFEPCNISWSEHDTIAKNGFLLRLLLHNIENSSPFFICLLGEKYGPYVEEDKGAKSAFYNSKKQSKKSTELFIPHTRKMNWIEKNLVIAQKTGYSSIVTPLTQNNSLLDLQIQTAVLNETNHEFFRFYYRQPEYIENKLKDLSPEERNEQIIEWGPENEYCEFKIKDLKTRLSRKGMSIKYYQSIEELDSLIYDDYQAIFKKIQHLTHMDRNKLRGEIAVFKRLKAFTLTESLIRLEESIKQFCKVDLNIKKISFKDDLSDSQIALSEETNEYVEILKLRHVSLVNDNELNKQDSEKTILLLVGPRGCGKTTFISYLYDKTNSMQHDVLYLFYFLKPNDSLYMVFVDIIKKMHLKYYSKDSTRELNEILHDRKAIIEQLHAALKMGPVIVFIDGVGEVESKNVVNLNVWLPMNLENNCKFIFTLNGTSSTYDFLIRTRKHQSIKLTMKTFATDEDYIMFFARQFKIETSKLLSVSNKKEVFTIPSDLLSLENQNAHNKLYEKAIKSLAEVKLARNSYNPFFCLIIAQELFTFDKDIFEIQFNLPEQRSSLVPDDDLIANSSSSNAVTVFNSYIEEVCTIRELVEKVIKRYILKYSWNANDNIQVSVENPGWIGDVLCFISLSLYGISKSSIMNLLFLNGYVNDYKVSDSDWYIFRQLFGLFLFESLNGMILFTHDYFKEAVQGLLLDGFYVELSEDQIDNSKSIVLIPKKNLSPKQLDIHFNIILDILTNRINKTDFINSSAICPNEDYIDLANRYFEIIIEMLINLNFLNDLPSINKILTNFRVIEIFQKNRIQNVSLWFKCLDLFKIIKPLKFFDLSLLNNLTNDLPHVMPINEIIHTQASASSSDNADTTNSTYQINLNTSVLQIDDEKSDNYDEFETENGKIDSSSSQKNSFNYTNLIDILVDFVPRSSEEEIYNYDKETTNLVLINRVLILNDIMLHLSEKTFLKNYSFKLLELVNQIVTSNYPLTDDEKYFYTKLLHSMSTSLLKLNEYEYSLTMVMKSIEICEDLYHTFEFSNLCKKYKKKQSFYRLSNFLSLEYSFMAFILIKINDISTAKLLLSKANEYNRLCEESKKVSHSSKDLDLDENLLFDVEEIIPDDSGYFRSKFYLNLYSALLYSQLNCYQEANKFFIKAIELTQNWFGETHANTAKAFHYYGCFLTLKQNEFYSTRKAELFLRKALSISEKYKDKVLSQLEKPEILDCSLIDKRQNSTQNNKQDGEIHYDPDLTSHYSNEKFDTEELISIATILHDLGCLLNEHKSDIIRKEGIDYLRRCLDTKVFIYGSNHTECQIVKAKLTNYEIKNNSSSTESNYQIRRNKLNNTLKLHQKSGGSNVTPRDKTLKSLENIRKEIRNDETHEKMSNWITSNSYIETIKPIDRNKKTEPSLVNTENYSKMANMGSRQRVYSAMIPSSFSANGTRQSKSAITPHHKACYVPSAFSIDIHNSASVHGPNSAIRDILAESLRDRVKNKPQFAVLKPIYYRSAWYDRPHGSSKKRFKKFRKLNPSEDEKLDANNDIVKTALNSFV